MSKIIPFPAAIIDYTNFISVNDVQKKLTSVEKFYAIQDLSKEGLRIDFTTPDYTILASDNSTSGCVIMPLNIAKYPGRVAFAFRAGLSDLA